MSTATISGIGRAKRPLNGRESPITGDFSTCKMPAVEMSATTRMSGPWREGGVRDQVYGTSVREGVGLAPELIDHQRGLRVGDRPL